MAQDEGDGLFDVYVNGVQFTVSAYDVLMEFTVRNSGDLKETPRVLGRIRMSPQHALVFAKLLTKNMDTYQQQVGRIDLPPRLFNDMGLEP